MVELGPTGMTICLRSLNTQVKELAGTEEVDGAHLGKTSNFAHMSTNRGANDK